MNSLVRHKPSKNSNHPCSGLTTMAERELSAFFKAITQSFGSKQAELSAEDWLRELVEADAIPASPRDWRLITAKALTRLVSRVRPSSLSAELQIA